MPVSDRLAPIGIVVALGALDKSGDVVITNDLHLVWVVPSISRLISRISKSGLSGKQGDILDVVELWVS